MSHVNMLMRALACVLIVCNVNALQLNVDPLSWSNAYSYCSSLGSHLAVIKSQQDADQIRELLTSNGIESVHVGVSDLQAEGKYYTVLGDDTESLCFNAWADGAPIGSSTLNCGSYSETGLTDADCNAEMPFICDIRDDYELIAGFGWYKHHTVRANWTNARQICASEDAHLLILNSEEELSVLYDKYRFIWVWVGVHNVYANQDFVTIYNEPLALTGFARWRVGDPVGDNLSHPYVALQSADGIYSSPGGNTREFICERQIQ